MYLPLLLSPASEQVFLCRHVLKLLTSHFIEGRIECVKVFRIQVILNDSERFTKPLEVNDFTFAEEFDRLSHIRIVNEAKDIIVSCSCFLFCCTFVKPTY